MGNIKEVCIKIFEYKTVFQKLNYIQAEFVALHLLKYVENNVMV